MKPKMVFLAVAALGIVAIPATWAVDHGESGGYVVKPGTFTGRIVLYDAQSSYAHSNIVRLAGFLTDQTRLNVVAEKGTLADPEDVKKALSAQIVLRIVDDANTPAMLIAPEDRWGIVNVSKLVDDLPTPAAKARFRDKRAWKEIIRTFSLLCGGGSSMFPGNMMNATTMRQLDHAVDTMPADVVERYVKYLKPLGITPREQMAYSYACLEGWAPAPTNDVQKAIWKKVHQIPDKPITIEYDPKTDK